MSETQVCESLFSIKNNNENLVHCFDLWLNDVGCFINPHFMTHNANLTRRNELRSGYKRNITRIYIDKRAWVSYVGENNLIET